MTLSIGELAKSIDHALLQPALAERDFDAGCELAMRWDVATVCVKSVDVRRARARLSKSTVAVCAVVGFPHANAPTDILCLEATRALDDGATEIDAVVNLANVLSGYWEAVQSQIEAIQAATSNRGGLLKMIFETGLIRHRDEKVKLCAICRDAGVSFVKTSTGFAIGRNADGGMTTLGATVEDVKLLFEHAAPVCRVKASGGIRTLDDALTYLRAGASRLGSASTEDILVEATRRLSAT